MSFVRWGIAGYGWLAREYAAPAIARDPSALLAGVFDDDPAARATARAAGLAAYDSLDALLATVDALYVAAPNHVHRELVERAAKRRRHVLCEKPIATNAADAHAMLASCEAANVVYATAYNQRFHPAHVALRSAIAGGALGTVTAVRIVYACWLPADWARDNWRIDRRRSGGGALIDLAPHVIDLTERLLDTTVVAARAMAQRRVHEYAVDDGAMVIGRCADGTLVSAHVAYNHPERYERRRLEIVGTGALAIAIDTMGQTAGGSLTLHGADGGCQRLAFDTERSPFDGLVADFSRTVLAGGGFDRGAAERERAAAGRLDALVADVDAELAACR